MWGTGRPSHFQLGKPPAFSPCNPPQVVRPSTTVHVRWYCRYAISYRDLEAMMTERGVAVDHSTIDRWVQRFAPEMEKRLRWQWRRPQSASWRIDETYVKVRGKWAYLYRALDKLGNTIDFYLSATRNTKAAATAGVKWSVIGQFENVARKGDGGPAPARQAEKKTV